jgi:hypothetical protein
MTRSRSRRRILLERTAAAGATLVVLLGIAGCSDDGGERERTAPAAVDFDTPPGPAGGPTVAAADPVTETLVGNSVSGPWTLAAAAGSRVRSVQVWAELTGCHRLLRGVAAQTAEAVTIAVLLRDVSKPGVECDASVVYQPVAIPLDAPPGDHLTRSTT